ncbi:MAG: bifunctional riboflavin kinase/FAD synthetase [Bacteroidetes bacterium]|nr:bifunctional riboflavin kinase/FAD synthetase [Bacteroidota bacterium]
MKIFRHLEDFVPFNNPVISIGTFDGVHIGHRTIINRLNEEAKRLNGESLLITLWPHPRLVVEKGKSSLQLLNTLDEKCKLLAKNGLQNLVILEFNYEFSRTSSEEFVTRILVETLKAKKIIIGYDHHFGRNREGSLAILRDYSPIFGFDVEETPAQQIDEINVSSTKIRNALLEGHVDQANHYLGYNYFISGKVVSGFKRGSRIGFPTANIQVNHPNKLIPKDGVYAVRMRLNENWYGGMMNIGNRPTFENAGHSLEVHLFDFDGDIYQKQVEVEFVKHLRDEQKFDGLEALQTQLAIDAEQARGILLLH